MSRNNTALQTSGYTTKDATSEGTFKWAVNETEVCYTWYRVTGSLSKSTLPPLIVLHGGPGCTHLYTLPMADLASDTRAVIHYDQIGNGSTTHFREKMGDTAFWTPKLFVKELQHLIAFFELEKYHVLGQSWGGFLAQVFALTQPKGLMGLILANPCCDFDMFEKYTDKLKLDLPLEVQEAIKRCEAAKDYKAPEYKAATKLFYSKHVCRIVPNPPEVQDNEKAMDDDTTVYATMNGPTEWLITGSLKHASLLNKIHAIKNRTLVCCGHYDELGPEVQQPLVDAIKGSRLIVYAESSHMPHWEEREKYMEDMGQFLASCDAN